jgi:tRNA (guanine-N7-)-methyltransferase
VSQLSIRTYKLRRGRITDGQRLALATLWDRFGIDLGAGRLDQRTTFGRVAPLVLDIGFGMGETTLAMAAADPGRDILAVDVHTPGAGALIRALADQGLPNVRVIVADVRDVLTELVAPGSLDEVRVFFPDPWPKVKHHKRRLIDAEFVRAAAEALRPGGTFHCATDWTPYAASISSLTAAEPAFVDTSADGQARPEHRPITRFENQGLAKGHRVYDIVCRTRSALPNDGDTASRDNQS